MPLVLDKIPGFADVPDSVLAAEQPAIGIHINRVSNNAAFGMVRLEVFVGTYKNTEEVLLPVSPIDKYAYSRAELLYFWVPQNTANPATGTASAGPPWSGWFGAWNVDPLTGKVGSTMGYRGNNDHKDRQMTTNDGILQVWTIAQRQRTGLILGTPPTYGNLVDANFYTDRPLHEGIAQTLNHNAKFSVVGTEVMYMGEFSNGDTVPVPVSPADGYTYTRATEVKYLWAWRWTADGTTAPTVPVLSEGQLEDFWASVDSSTGVVSVNVGYGLNGDHVTTNGRVAVFAFCTRVATMGAEASTFAEIAQDVFQSGQTLHANVLKALMRNAKEASLTPEFFYGEYANGATVPLPVSPIDSYSYVREELQYIWTYKTTGPNASRLDMLRGFIDGSSGLVSIDEYRLYDDEGHLTLEHTGTLSVLVFAARQRQAASIDQTPISSPIDAGDGAAGDTPPGGFYVDGGGVTTGGGGHGVAVDTVALTWDPSPDPAVASYNIYRGIVSGGPYTKVAQGLTTTHWDDNAAVAGRTYYYNVTAVSPDGESDYAGEFSITA